MEQADKILLRDLEHTYVFVGFIRYRCSTIELIPFIGSRSEDQQIPLEVFAMLSEFPREKIPRNIEF